MEGWARSASPPHRGTHQDGVDFVLHRFAAGDRQKEQKGQKDKEKASGHGMASL